MNNTQRILQFDVDKQRIVRNKSCDFSGIVAGSKGYLYAKFFFVQEEWHECRKAASFWIDDQEYAVLLDENDSCEIPAEALTGDRFYVSVTILQDGRLIPTNKTKVKQEVR